MYDSGFNFDSQEYVPICDDQTTRKHLYQLWLTAAAKTLQSNVEFAICAIRLDIIGWQVEIMLHEGE